MSFLKRGMTLYEKSWKSASPSCLVFLSQMPSFPSRVEKEMNVLFFLCLSFVVCFHFRLCLCIIITASQYAIRQYGRVSCQFSQGSMWILTLLFLNYVFIAQPLMKSNRRTEPPTPDCVPPDPWKWGGGRRRSTCVNINLQRKFDQWKRWWSHYLSVGRLCVCSLYCRLYTGLYSVVGSDKIKGLIDC